jgi:tetratricopeptide (TPR) repeat protein
MLVQRGVHCTDETDIIRKLGAGQPRAGISQFYPPRSRPRPRNFLKIEDEDEKDDEAIKNERALPKRPAFGYFPSMKHFAALVGLILAVALPQARAQQSPDDQYIAIYSLIDQADTLQAAGQPRSAMAGYTQAMAELQKFQKMFPDWDAKIVSYRLDYLTRKVNDLAVQFPAATPGVTPPPAPTNAVVSVIAPATNVVSTAPDADMEMQIGTLRAQVQGLQEDNDTLQAKLKEALSAQPATVDTQELARAQSQALSLIKENDLLRACLTNGATNAATNGDAAGQLLKIRQALADANQKLTEETGRVDKLALENQSLRSEVSVGGLEKAALEKRLQQRQTPAPVTVNDEVKLLRARLAVDEAQSVPYTPEELALLKSSPPVPVANAGEQNKSVNELPSGSALLVAEAQSYFSAGDYDKAEADYRQILQREPGNALALANLAAIELQEGKLDEAETHITAALAKTPNDAYTLSTFGFLKFRQQKFDEALDALSRAANLDPQNPQIQNYLGVALSHKGLRIQAETALRKAIELDPNYGAAHNNLAVIYLGETPPMVELARWHYQKALDLGQPHNPDLEKMLSDLGAPVNSQ